MTQYDDDDTFEDGVLRDGTRHRVAMRDRRAPMITDGTSDPLGSHRPGWRIPSGGSESDVALRDSQHKLVEEAHAEYIDRLTNAWKGNRSTDARGRSYELDAGRDEGARPDRVIAVKLAVARGLLRRGLAVTLIVSAWDGFNTLPAAEFAACKIPGTKLIIYEEGPGIFYLATN